MIQGWRQVVRIDRFTRGLLFLTPDNAGPNLCPLFPPATQFCIAFTFRGGEKLMSLLSSPPPLPDKLVPVFFSLSGVICQDFFATPSARVHISRSSCLLKRTASICASFPGILTSGGEASEFWGGGRLLNLSILEGAGPKMAKFWPKS